MAPYLFCVFFVLLSVFSIVYGDIYMHNPRGCNDRLNEDGDRDNANRLFDSQNNARGGYCWGPALTFYEGNHHIHSVHFCVLNGNQALSLLLNGPTNTPVVMVTPTAISSCNTCAPMLTQINPL
jgi:hypothetical protein